MYKNPADLGINYQPQLVNAGFLRWTVAFSLSCLEAPRIPSLRCSFAPDDSRLLISGVDEEQLGRFFIIHFLRSMVVSGSPKRWDRWHSPSPNWQEQYHLYTTEKVLAFWGVICYLPPFRGTRNNYWLDPVLKECITTIFPIKKGDSLTEFDTWNMVCLLTFSEMPPPKMVSRVPRKWEYSKINHVFTNLFFKWNLIMKTRCDG